ncbi:hypothetical protein B0H14DRAFT_2579274 [Mycena olivaceomarginata]|nr:hypothetical protein B0H14DRAFT_2579274 [Mycena olivaceomarginata]
MDSMPPSTLAASLGALQIGVFVSHVLFGLIPRGPPTAKSFVCIGDTLYDYTISNYGHPERLVGALPKSLMATVFLTSIIATLAQGFFTFRVYMLSKRLYIMLGISFMLFLHLISTTTIFFIGMRMTSLPSFESQWGWMIIVSLAFSSATDLMITTFLVGFLLNQHFGVHNRTMALVDKLIAWTIALITRFGFLASLSSTVLSYSFQHLEHCRIGPSCNNENKLYKSRTIP